MTKAATGTPALAVATCRRTRAPESPGFATEDSEFLEKHGTDARAIFPYQEAIIYENQALLFTASNHGIGNYCEGRLPGMFLECQTDTRPWNILRWSSQ